MTSLPTERHSPTPPSSIWLLSAKLCLSRSLITLSRLSWSCLQSTHSRSSYLISLQRSVGHFPFLESTGLLTPFSTDFLPAPGHPSQSPLLISMPPRATALSWALSTQLHFISSHPTAFNITHADKCYIYSPVTDLSSQVPKPRR